MIQNKSLYARTIQQTFDIVISHGYYNPINGADTSKQFMCLSLKLAFRHGIITPAEYNYADDEILQYLASDNKFIPNTLGGLLSYHNLPCAPADLLAIYKDWNNRPKLGE